MRKLVIARYKDGIATALFADKRAVELSFERSEDTSLVGNIYIGKTGNVVQNIRAAFVEIEGGVPCYFSLDDNPQPIFTSRAPHAPGRLVQGDEFLVQVTRDSAKGKAPTVTSELSLSGKYLVVTTHRLQIGTSSKLPASLREELAARVGAFADPGYGWIVRTNAAGADIEELRKEAGELAARMSALLKTAEHFKARSCLYRNPPSWLSSLKNLYDSAYDEIVTDEEALFDAIRETLGDRPDKKLTLYQDRLLPLAALYSLQSAFEEALRPHVWLKSGAYLVIEATEALISIDVNTGKCEHGKNAEDTFLKINLEAAGEIARQLRLRNLSGMILIDFINMKSKEDQKLLMRRLDAFLREDPVKACVVDMTALGLVEVTRKRMQRPLAEKMGNAGKPA